MLLMAGGRPPTPTNVLKINGGLRKGRHDDRDSEPQPVGDAQMMAPLTGHALECWERYLPQLISLGLATELDSAELSAMCGWWGEYMKWCAMDEGVNDYRRLTGMATAYKQFRTIAAKFGLTPSDRAGLTGVTRTTDDELSELIA